MLIDQINLKMLTLISLITIYTIGLQVNCNPINSNLESIEDRQFSLPSTSNLNKLNSELKQEKRSYLNLYQSEITQTLPGQKVASVNEDNNSVLNDNEQEHLRNAENTEEFHANVQRKCYVGSAIRDICERCAKITRSEMAFNLCCTDKDEVRDWCTQFFEFSYVSTTEKSK